METESAIKKRTTVKVLGNVSEPFTPSNDRKEVIREMISTAGQAPFHYACYKSHREGELSSIVPWRFHTLHAAECRKLMKWFTDNNIEGGKITQMLAAADALLMVTWLPDLDDLQTGRLFSPTLRNMEHIAASSAAIQNLLLTATSRGITNYWSSGGILREERIFDLLGISRDEILLGAVFLFPDDTRNAEIAGGKLSDLRGDATTWAREVVVKW